MKIPVTTNHLGNVLVTVSARPRLMYDNQTFTHKEADVTSVSDYYPFGMLAPGRHWQSDSYRFGFNSQEKLDEIAGLGNHNTALFWEYDTRTGRRWNLDPKPNPAISHYSTFACNPILFVDFYGDTVQVTFRAGGFLGLRKNTLNYDSGKLFNRDGSEYSGKISKYGQKTVAALDELSIGKVGNAALSELISSQNVFNIRKTSGSNSFRPKSVAQAGLALNPNLPNGFNVSGTGGTIFFNPNSTSGGLNTRGETSRPAFIGLGHELLGHGLSANRGFADYRVANSQFPGVTNDEFFACDMENRIRAEHFLSLRAFYAILTNVKFNLFIIK
jgi:hypothetical protein